MKFNLALMKSNFLLYLISQLNQSFNEVKFLISWLTIAPWQKAWSHFVDSSSSQTGALEESRIKNRHKDSWPWINPKFFCFDRGVESVYPLESKVGLDFITDSELSFPYSKI